MNCYDPCLKEYLPANNNSSDVVLNNKFSKWENHISENLKKRSGNKKYESGIDKKLLNICLEHSKDYEKEIKTNNLIFLTHPFYLSLTHMDELNNDTADDASNYLCKLMSLFNEDFPKDKASIVILETIHHYAAATSLLLENDMVDKVIFSEYDSGSLLKSKSLKKFKKSKFFMGGGYNNKCLETSFKEVYNVVKNSDKQVFAIKDLIIESPKEKSTTLKPKKIFVGKNNNLLETNILTLEQVMLYIDNYDLKEQDFSYDFIMN